MGGLETHPYNLVHVPCLWRVAQCKQPNALNSLTSPGRKTNCHELTLTERAYLVGRQDASKSFSQISHKTSVSRSTVIDTVQNAEKKRQYRIPTIQ